MWTISMNKLKKTSNYSIGLPKGGKNISALVWRLTPLYAPTVVSASTDSGEFTMSVFLPDSKASAKRPTTEKGEAKNE